MWYVRLALAQITSAYAQFDHSICWSHEYSMTVEILTEHLLELLSLTGDCTGSSESTLVQIVREHMSWLLFSRTRPK